MADELASANVNRAYTLAALSIAIFTFTLFFMYPRFLNGEINPWLFQATLVLMGVATFAFVFASFSYYCVSAIGHLGDPERRLWSRRGDRFWLLGYTLLFFAPSLILFSIGLRAVAGAWFALWVVYLLFVIRYFPRILAPRQG